MSITFHEDDDYEDPERILDDDPTPEELMIEEQVEQLTGRMAALQMLGGAAAPVSTPRGATPQVSTTGQFPDPSLLLRSNTVKLAPSASEALKIFLSRTPVPDNPAPNTRSPSRGLPTRQQARIAKEYMAAMSSSPGMVTRSCTTCATGATRARQLIAGGRPTPPTPAGRVTQPTAGERRSTTRRKGPISGGRELVPTTQWGGRLTPPTTGGRVSTSARGSTGGRVSTSGGIAD